MFEKMSRFLMILALALLMSALVTPPMALAHDGRPRLDLGAERSSPGANLEIRGINIAAEQPVTLALIGPDSEFPLGTVVGDEHGDFVLTVEVPREALAGAYTVRAVGTNRVIVAAPLTVFGVAQYEEAEQRGEDEPLLAPMPQPAAVKESPPPAQPQTAGAAIPLQTEAPSPSMPSPVILVGVAMAFASALVLAIWRGRRAGKPSERFEAPSTR
jgi:hypothetical protein